MSKSDFLGVLRPFKFLLGFIRNFRVSKGHFNFLKNDVLLTSKIGFICYPSGFYLPVARIKFVLTGDFTHNLVISSVKKSPYFKVFSKKEFHQKLKDHSRALRTP